MGSRARFAVWHRRFALAALFALLLHAWIPAGFMPASDGSLALVLCPGIAPAASIAHGAAAGHHKHDGGQHGANLPCPFAVAAIAAAPPAPAALPAPPIFVADMAPPPRAPPALLNILDLRPPATGPPIRL